MKNTNTIMLLVLTVLMLPLAAGVSAQNTTLDGAALLKVDATARPAGMGGAFVSIDGDARSPIYNPAAAVGSGGFQVSLGHTEYWEDIRLETGVFTKSVAPKWWLHGGIRYGTVDNIEAREIASSEPTSLFDANDVSFKLGLAYMLTPRVAIGASGGWIMEKIEAYRGSSFNLDLGLWARLRDNVTLGASVTQLGGDLELSADGKGVSGEVPLPTIYRVGGSYAYDRYLGAADVVIIDDEAHAHLGAEAMIHEMLTARAGYMTGYDSKSFTFGVSFTKRQVAVDYAFVPFSENLGNSHLFNLTLSL